MYTLNDFGQLTAQYGIAYSNAPIINGDIHRFGILEDKRERPCWYVLHQLGDGLVYGAFGCWKRGIKIRYCNRHEKSLTSQQKSAICQKNIEIENQLKQLLDQFLYRILYQKTQCRLRK